MIDPNFILLICFIGFMGISFKLGYRKSLKKLDQQINSVSKTVEDAFQTLRQAEKKQLYELEYSSSIENEIAGIFQKTHTQIEEIKQKAQNDLQKIIQQRSANAQCEMDRLHKQMIRELKGDIMDQVIKTLKHFLSEYVSPNTHKEINETMLGKLEHLFEEKDSLPCQKLLGKNS